jgi:hypothetical protein
MNRSVLLAASAVALTLAAAGCGGSGDANSGAKSGANANPNLEKAVKYAQCMRENGLTDFPDPDKNGKFMISAGGPKRDSPQFKKAQQACKSQEPPGIQDDPAEVAKDQASWLKFANCMRQNGIRDFPDPKNGRLLVDRNRINVNTPQFKNALKACRGVGGGSGDANG